MRNKAHKQTLNKLRDNPNYEFHSEWHKNRHLQAKQDIHDEFVRDTILGLIAAAILTPIIIVLCMGGM